MRILFVELPIFLLLFGWMIGRCRITRAVVVVGVLVSASQALIIASFMASEPMYFLAAVAILPFAIVLAVAFSFATSKQISPAPADYAIDATKRAASAYQALSPDQKAKVHHAGGILAKLAGMHLARHLRSRGYHQTADVIRDVSRMKV